MNETGRYSFGIGDRFSETLRHVPGNSNYNPGFRQLIHVGYKVASELGSVYTDALKTNAAIIGDCVTENIYARHIMHLFKKQPG